MVKSFKILWFGKCRYLYVYGSLLFSNDQENFIQDYFFNLVWVSYRDRILDIHILIQIIEFTSIQPLYAGVASNNKGIINFYKSISPLWKYQNFFECLSKKILRMFSTTKFNLTTIKKFATLPRASYGKTCYKWLKICMPAHTYVCVHSRVMANKTYATQTQTHTRNTYPSYPLWRGYAKMRMCGLTCGIYDFVSKAWE